MRLDASLMFSFSTASTACDLNATPGIGAHGLRRRRAVLRVVAAASAGRTWRSVGAESAIADVVGSRRGAQRTGCKRGRSDNLSFRAHHQQGRCNNEKNHEGGNPCHCRHRCNSLPRLCKWRNTRNNNKKERDGAQTQPQRNEVSWCPSWVAIDDE